MTVLKGKEHVIPKFADLTRPQKAVYLTVGVVGLAIIGPVLGMAAFAVQNMFMFGVWALAIMAGITFLGPLNRILKTTALKLAKANARLNPIETLELDYEAKRKALDRFVEFVKKMMASQKVSQGELDQLKKDFPQRNLSDRQEMMDKMASAVKILRTKATGAEEQLTTYGEEIRFIKADNAFAIRATTAMKEMRAVQGADALDELLKGEAIGQVRQNVATAFAELDMLLEQDDVKMAMAFDQSAGNNPLLIEGTAVEIPHFFERKKDKVKA